MSKKIVYLQDSEVQSSGRIWIDVENADGTKANVVVKNKVLQLGRAALAAGLANDFHSNFQFFIRRVFFSNGGTLGGTPRLVDDSRVALFNLPMLAKPVSASIDPLFSTQVTFTSVITFSELVGQVINEMALEMANGQLFSMATFGDINKSSTMQLTWNWRITFV